MGDPSACGRCGQPLTDPSVRACEHLASRPLVSSTDLQRCLRCHEVPAERLAELCAACATDQLALRVAVTEADVQRGWAIAPAEAMARVRRHPLHPLPRLGPGRWAKLSFVTIPMREPRHIESMWVKVTGDGERGWLGELDNQPEVLTELEPGSEIAFADDQVVNVAMDTNSRELPTGEHACAYCDLELRRAQQELDEGDERLLVATGLFGFMVFRIGADDEAPGFAFTVGLAHRFDHPELICFGPDADVLGELVRGLANQVAAGRRFEDGEVRTDVLHRASLRFEALPDDREEARREFLGYACWFHRHASFPVLQMVWSDHAGRFPGDDGFEVGLEPWQVSLRGDRS